MGMDIAVLGVDLGKNVCSVVGLDASGAVVMRRKVRRETLIALAEKLPACVVGMEAVLRRPSSGPRVRRPRSRRAVDVARICPALCQGAEERRSRRRGDRGSGDATDDALCRTEEPRASSLDHADALRSGARDRSGRLNADGSDQSAARHLC